MPLSARPRSFLPVPRALRAALGLALALGIGAGPSAAEPLPTDTCVARKLDAAARACKDLLFVESQRSFRPERPGGESERGGEGRSLDAQTEQILARLARSWRRAEWISSREGADCRETTVEVEELAGLVAAAASDLAGVLEEALGTRGPDAACGRTLLRRAGLSCQRLLRGESDFVLDRFVDPDAARDAHEALAAGFEASDRCADPQVVAEANARTEALVDEVVKATTVSPAVPPTFTMIDPGPGPVHYRGNDLRPVCSRGTPYVFFARRGTSNNLLVYYQGGGACWNYLTCEAFPVFADAADASDNPGTFPVGFFDLANPENPFHDWNIVFVPYCTGDIHWGNATFDHPLVPGSATTATIEHKGWQNAQVVEKWAREHFVRPDRIFVSGSSAGAYGALLNSVYLQEHAYPGTDTAVLADAGNGVITDDFLQNDLVKWGIETTIPRWIPALDVPITSLNAADVVVEAARFYPRNRFANYTTSYDGGTGGQTGFYQIMLNPFFINEWFQWWKASCAWNGEMRTLAYDAASRAANYRYYIGSGSRHTVFFNDKVYTDTTGGVTPVRDWVAAMIDDGPGWTSEECAPGTCGILLPGDPRPSPPVPPFTPDGRIECTP